MELNQYEIVWVNLDPTMGVEMKKMRPCVIISPDEMNRNLRTLVIAPMTTKSRKYPTRLEVTHKRKKGWVVLDQIRTVDRKRVIRTTGKLSPSEINKLKAIIDETYVQ